MDSVELVMEFENYFGLRIPNREAETLTTIGEVIDYVSKRLAVQSDGQKELEAFFHRFKAAISQAGLRPNGLTLQSPVAQWLSPEKSKEWQAAEASLGMLLPKPQTVNSGNRTVFERLFRFPLWRPAYDWQAITVEHFLICTLAHNLDEWVDRNKIAGRIEIYAAVMKITVDKTGVDYFEIEPSKSFTNDLGVD